MKKQYIIPKIICEKCDKIMEPRYQIFDDGRTLGYMGITCCICTDDTKLFDTDHLILFRNGKIANFEIIYDDKLDW